MLKYPLTNLQMEILELYSTDLTEKELYELKTMLGRFYAGRAVQEADRIWDERNLSDEITEQWLNE